MKIGKQCRYLLEKHQAHIFKNPSGRVHQFEGTMISSWTQLDPTVPSMLEVVTTTVLTPIRQKGNNNSAHCGVDPGSPIKGIVLFRFQETFTVVASVLRNESTELHQFMRPLSVLKCGDFIRPCGSNNKLICKDVFHTVGKFGNIAERRRLST